MPAARQPKTVTTAAIAGAVVTILVWAIEQFGKITVPANVSAAATTLIIAGAAWIESKRS